MKCWFHKWLIKKIFCKAVIDIRGYECSKCHARKLEGSSCAIKETWHEAIEWRDKVPQKSQILRIVK